MPEISGVQIAEKIIERIKDKRPNKILVAIAIDADAVTESFLRQKEKAAEKANVRFLIKRLPKNINNEELKKEIEKLGRDSEVGGIIVQLPFPANINGREILAAIPAEKDVDALSAKAVIEPPVVGVIQEILRETNFSLAGKKICLVGMGILIGKPTAGWLNKSGFDFETFEKGDNLSPVKKADLIILGAGVPGLIKADGLKSGSAVIDFGYRFVEGRVSGDLKTSSGTERLSFYTPTPGGTGPILVAKLLENFIKLCQKD